MYKHCLHKRIIIKCSDLQKRHYLKCVKPQRWLRTNR
ncbi:hypothetical protein [Sporosarcina sp. P20a]